MADQGLPPPMAQLNFNAGAPSLEGALPQFSFIPQNPSAASPINQVYAITRAPEAAVTPPIIPTIMKDPSKYLDPSMVVQPSRSSGEIDRPTSPTILPPSQPSIITPHPNPTPNVPLGSGRYVDVFGNRVLLMRKFANTLCTTLSGIFATVPNNLKLGEGKCLPF